MTDWHTLDRNGVLKALAALPPVSGSNRLAGQEGVSWPRLLLRQFKSILVLMLGAAALLSLAVGDRIDAVAILAIIVLNAFLGFAQEWKAENALSHLKTLLVPYCRVMRGGHICEVRAESLRPGDHVVLAAGDAVPADIRLLHALDLQADESALTGESMAVDKGADALPADVPPGTYTNIAYAGTHIISGRGDGLVVAIGMDTAVGHIARLAGTIRDSQTRLQLQLAALARILGSLALGVAFLVFIIGLADGRDAAQMLMTGISLAVAAVPEGLPAVVTITLAIGVAAMARKNALLRHLQAAETLGAVSVICTDKTGTLTLNQMMVTTLWLPSGIVDVDGEGYGATGGFHCSGKPIEAALQPDLIALLDTGRKCNHTRIERSENAVRIIGSATEAALLVAAEKAGLPQDFPFRLAAEHAFSPERKRMALVEETETQFISHVKGAPETILPLCRAMMKHGIITSFPTQEQETVRAAYRMLAGEGLRVMALARRSWPKGEGLSGTEEELTFLGLAGVMDPPRPEVRLALAQARQAGIRVIMITGDSPDTAQAVAAQIGLPVTRAVSSADISTMSDEDLSVLLRQDILFARTLPEDKYRIVRLLQAQKQLVAMTGDGVNDAPALKQADVGIAMGIRGTDVARGAADIVLTDDNFASIIAAIAEGRRQYENIGKFVKFLTAHSMGEVSAVFFNILLGGPLILLPLQILWINLATDSVTALAFSVEKAECNLMMKVPRMLDRPLLDRRMILMMVPAGAYVGLAALFLFEYYLAYSYALANTVALTTIVVTAQVLAFSFRNLEGPLSAIGWFSNPWLLLAVAAMLGMQAAALYWAPLAALLHTVPLQPQHWAAIVAASLPLFILPEIYKTIKNGHAEKLRKEISL